jgi:hypothetical protein
MPDTLKIILTKAIQQSPSADNSQPWHITWQDSTLILTYDTKRVADKTFPANSPAILLSMGAALENLKQVTAITNTDVQIELSSQIDTSLPYYFKAHFQQADLNRQIQADLSAVFNRHTNRLSFSPEPISDDVLIALNKFTAGKAKIRIITEKKDLKHMAYLVKKASEIRFKTREVNEWLGKSLRFGSEAGKTKDGLDIATLDLPPGGGYFLRLISNWKIMRVLNLFGTHITMSLIDSAPVKHAPALVAITASSNIMEAGQLMEKVWIELNSKGIAVHPYYVICDQLHRRKMKIIPTGLEKKADLIASEVQDFFQFKEDETLEMLLRIGAPKKTAIHSKRLPLSKLCTGL